MTGGATVPDEITPVDLDEDISSSSSAHYNVSYSKSTSSRSSRQGLKARIQEMRNSVNEKQRHVSSIFGGTLFDGADSESEDVSSVGSSEHGGTSSPLGGSSPERKQPASPPSLLDSTSQTEVTSRTTTTGTGAPTPLYPSSQSHSTTRSSARDVETGEGDGVGIEWTDFQHSDTGSAWTASCDDAVSSQSRRSKYSKHQDDNDNSTTTPIGDVLAYANSTSQKINKGGSHTDVPYDEDNNNNDKSRSLTIPTGDSDDTNNQKEVPGGGVGKSNRRSLMACCWGGDAERVMPDYDEHLGEGRQYWRDIILGVNDGLVSTFLLIAGVTGASLSNTDILLTALSGTIAGAISMAAGEYVATKTQQEVMDGEIALERKHISKNRDFELQELKEAFGIIGIPEEDESEEVVNLRRHLMNYYATNDEAHLQVHAVLELGVVEEEKRNPFVAGGVAFFLFFFGAMPSVIPFLCTSNIMSAFIAAAVCTTTGLLAVGAVKTWATRGNLWLASLENLLIAAGGGCIAYGVGVGFEKLVNR